ncbi:MAG: hypothetical protein WC162_07345 [Sphaerochaetaceae bacterium]
MRNYSNGKKDKFINSFPTESLESGTCNISDRCKFNFSFFDCSQEAGQDFKDWTMQEICKLLKKLIEYSKMSLKHWETVAIGSGKHKRSVYVSYGNFPRKTDFYFPKHIPYQAIWGRFRLEQSVRLVGFTIPSEFNETKSNNKKTEYKFDCNTFYIVFLDKNHRFYKMDK